MLKMFKAISDNQEYHKIINLYYIKYYTKLANLNNQTLVWFCIYVKYSAVCKIYTENKKHLNNKMLYNTLF